MKETNLPEGSLELVKMEYEKLQDYYLWSLGTHSDRLSLYVKLLSGALAACVTVAFSTLPQKLAVCAGIGAAFLIVGVLMLERVVTGQVTNSWCIFRLNMLRSAIRGSWGMHEIFRPIPLRSLRQPPLFDGLLRYRLKAAGLIVTGNSLAAGGTAVFWLLNTSATAAIICGCIAGGFVWFLQLEYFNKEYQPMHGYLVRCNEDYDQEMKWMSTVATTRNADKGPVGCPEVVTTTSGEEGDRRRSGTHRQHAVLRDGWNVLDAEADADRPAKDSFCHYCQD